MNWSEFGVLSFMDWVVVVAVTTGMVLAFALVMMPPRSQHRGETNGGWLFFGMAVVAVLSVVIAYIWAKAKAGIW